MANAIYPLWKQSIMSEFSDHNSLDQVDAANGCYVTLITTIAGGYTYSNAHQFYTAITGVQAAPVQIIGNTVINNVFDGADVVFIDVTASQISAIVIHRQNPGANSTWRLVLYEDTGIIGLPLSINGGNVLLKWNVSGIFAL